MIHFNLVIITTNHIYIGAVYIMAGLIGGSIGFGLFWFISAGVITMIISDRHSNRLSLDPLRGGDLLLP